MPKKNTQFGIGSMMLLMLVCAVMSAGFFYASRVDVIQSELNLNPNAGGSILGQEGRIPHIIFIMFTFTSPLILAGTLATIVSILRWRGNRNGR
ncbi:MAG: hypothetical protein ACON5D_05835 [Rubripirellula sp.]